MIIVFVAKRKWFVCVCVCEKRLKKLIRYRTEEEFSEFPYERSKLSKIFNYFNCFLYFPLLRSGMRGSFAYENYSFIDIRKKETNGKQYRFEMKYKTKSMFTNHLLENIGRALDVQKMKKTNKHLQWNRKPTESVKEWEISFHLRIRNFTDFRFKSPIST